MSFTLNIRKKNGDHYWTEYFNSIEFLKKWLDEEKTRPYWDKTFIVQIIEPVIDEAKEKEKKDFEEKEKKEKKDLKLKIKDILNSKDLTQDQIKEALKLLLAQLEKQIVVSE